MGEESEDFFEEGFEIAEVFGEDGFEDGEL
jgi:hypothetical protein